MKTLVLGSSGQLGQCLADQSSAFDFDCIFSSKSQIDITDFNKTAMEIKNIQPRAIINAAAYTSVDGAEKERDLADSVNHRAVGNLATLCAKLDILLIHISTDYVFDGDSCKSYVEDDATNPTGIYGRTKLLGERAIIESDCQYAIVRTSWLFSEYHNNFLKTMLRVASKNEALRIVDDQYGCPTYAQDLAHALLVCLVNGFSTDRLQEIYHYAGDHECSWYSFAQYIFKVSLTHGFSTPDKIKPITTEEYPTAAQRPAYSSLNSAKYFKHFGEKPSDWRKGVELSLEALVSNRELGS